jgi:predicted nucleotidyltransferase
MSDDRVLAAITRLGEDFADLRGDFSNLRGEVTKLRVDVMARIDRLQHAFDAVREDVLVSFGRAETVERTVKNETEMRQLLQQQVDRVWKRVLSMDGRLRAVEDRQEGGPS